MELAQRGGPGRRVRGDGEPLQPDREDHDEHDPGDELRDGREGEPRHADAPVDRPAAVERGQHPGEDAERNHDHEGHRGQLERAPEGREQEGADRQAELGGGAQVAVQRCPIIQLQYWVISGRSTPRLMVQRQHGAFGGERAEDLPARVARQHRPREEDDQAQQDQGEQRQPQSLQYVPWHSPSASPSWPPGPGDDDRPILLSTALDSHPVRSGAQWPPGCYAFETCGFAVPARQGQ